MNFEGSIKLILRNRQYFRGVNTAYTKRYTVFLGVNSPYTKQYAGLLGVYTAYTKQYAVFTKGR